MFNSCCEHSFSGKIAKYFFHSGLKFVTFQKLFMPTFNFLSRFLSVVCLCLLWGSCTIRRRYAWNSHTHKGIWHKGICTVLSPSKHSVNSICLIFEALRDRPKRFLLRYMANTIHTLFFYLCIITWPCKNVKIKFAQIVAMFTFKHDTTGG